MHGFFTKIMALGIVASGFFLTGDLHWLMDRVGGWVRGETTQATPLDRSDAATDTVLSEPVRNDASSSVSPATGATTDATPGSSASLPAGGVKLPALSHEQIDISALRPGDRILARTQHELVAFDLIDPLSREAIEHRHALLASDVATAAALTTPRRVLLPASMLIGQPPAFPAVAGSQDAAPPPAGGIEALGLERPLE